MLGMMAVFDFVPSLVVEDKLVALLRSSAILSTGDAFLTPEDDTRSLWVFVYDRSLDFWMDYVNNGVESCMKFEEL